MKNNNNNVKNRDEISKSIESKHLILFPDGKEMNLNLDDVRNNDDLRFIEDKELEAYILAEEIKGIERKEPPSIELMKKHELVGYEISSDAGNLRFYPKGKLIFDLLKDWAEEIAVGKLEAVQIESPLIYDFDDEQIRSQAESFHENHYLVRVPDDEKKEFILRFAGDFGLFKIMKDANISHRILPVRIYEYSQSFRYERRGSLAGLRRLRAFHMPDVHCFCKDLEQGFEEYAFLYKSYSDLAKKLEINYAIVFRIVEEFYNKHKNKIVELLRYSKRPAFIEVLSEMKHYWAIKHEFQAIDSVEGNVQLSSVQLDVKDAKIYGINYVDSDGNRKGCIICHSSIGSIERWMYSILEHSLKSEKPSYPLWLAPIQVRIIPVAKQHVGYCKELEFDGIRFDIDDCDDSLSKKIVKAQKEWIPYIVVVGDDEIRSGNLMVNIRLGNKKEKMKKEDLNDLIKSKIKGMPFRNLPVSKYLSKRIIFC